MKLLQMIGRAFRQKTPVEVLAEHLVQAALDRALHAQAREYHSAMEEMLVERIKRIEGDLDIKRG